MVDKDCYHFKTEFIKTLEEEIQFSYSGFDENE